MAGPSAALVFDAGLLPPPGQEAAVEAMLRRFRQRGVRVVSLLGLPAAAPPLETDAVIPGAVDRPGPILRTLAGLQVQPADAWLVTRQPERIALAGTTGLLGVVLVGSAPPQDTGGVWVRSAATLPELPLALVPPAGGCWHRA